MSSTEVDPRQAKAIAGFYRTHILPLVSAGGVTVDLSPRATDPGETAYVTRADTRMTQKSFELRFADEKQIIDTLRSQWRGTPLESVPEPLLRLAREFEHVEQAAEISAFVYEMF